MLVQQSLARRGHKRCHCNEEGFGTLSRQLGNDESYNSSRVGVSGCFVVWAASPIVLQVAAEQRSRAKKARTKVERSVYLIRRHTKGAAPPPPDGAVLVYLSSSPITVRFTRF